MAIYAPPAHKDLYRSSPTLAPVNMRRVRRRRRRTRSYAVTGGAAQTIVVFAVFFLFGFYRCFTAHRAALLTSRLVTLCRLHISDMLAAWPMSLLIAV